MTERVSLFSATTVHKDSRGTAQLILNHYPNGGTYSTFSARFMKNVLLEQKNIKL
jgi:hypothetical protein